MQKNIFFAKEMQRKYCFAKRYVFLRNKYFVRKIYFLQKMQKEYFPLQKKKIFFAKIHCFAKEIVFFAKKQRNAKILGNCGNLGGGGKSGEK